MNFSRPLILASSSPRRQYLMREAGFEFTVDAPNIDESFPHELPVNFVPKYLAEKKALIFRPRINNEIVITADTIVILNSDILNKPGNREEAISMLTRLSGQTHTVITAVCLLDKNKMDCFDDHTKVTFKKLTRPEIEFYIDTYKPYDKAGAYGAQDWIGMVAIKKINGSYFTVMGMPMHLVYTHLMSF
ncbi:MAG: septum formation protein Maf [Cyclobacteriaceae bacterium]|nr:septum formation protein Maf [Cyclobacteriaceae bacterium]